MRTSEEIYHRVRWDARFDPARFVLGVSRRGKEPKRVPLPSFVPGGEIPWHRVVFIEADGERVWDRESGVDAVGKTGAGLARAPRRLRAPHFTARPAFTWDGRAWQADAAPQAAPSAAAGLRVLTWNTLWNRYDGERLDTARRRPALLDALRAADADVIALQEVEADLVTLLAAVPWVRAAYTLTADPGSPQGVDDTGLLLLSRFPVRETGELVLGSHKAALAITVDAPSGPLVVATTHLTSNHTESAKTRRNEELTLLAEALADVEGEAVLLGDFNDGTDLPAVSLGMRDAWTEVRGAADGTPTFDPGANPLAAMSSLTGRAQRLDRVLLREVGGSGPGAGLHPASAELIGDVPGDDGLFVSDHYGVAVALVPADVAAGSVLDAPPTARTAVAWLPPDEVWPAIQDVRTTHDPAIHRWPPHVNVLFGFVAEADFDRALPLLAEAAAEVAPFEVRLDGVHTFGHRDDATVWLDPAGDTAGWHDLHQALRRRFPRCRGRHEGFTPHLTLGRSRDPQRVATESAARLRGVGDQAFDVGELVVLSRRGTEPMRVRAAVALGTGEVRAVTDPGPGAEAAHASPAADHTAAAVAQRIADALPEGVVHTFGSRRMRFALANADLDLVAALPGQVDAAGIQRRITAALPEATGVRAVVGARVPGLRLAVGTLHVDVLLVGTGTVAPAEAVVRRAELGDDAAVALSAVTDADAVRGAVAAAGVADEAAGLVRAVKAWARARGLDAAPFGGLSSLAWTLLAARTAAAAPALGSDARLRRFFGDWASWDWAEPVALSTPATTPPAPGPLTVLTPTAPVRSCTQHVSAAGRDLVTAELYRAWEILDTALADGTDPWPDLLAPPPLHARHAAWLTITVRADSPTALAVAEGRFRGRVRGLLGALDDLGADGVHAWPRPYDTTPAQVRYAIGLGRTPLPADTVADAARRWAKDLPGTDTAVVDGGSVPTLR